jgi:IclR family KDG regulon transcriptional repressor
VATARETSIRRGVETLLALADEEAQRSGGLGVTRIADMVGREKSQVSRALKVLAEYGLVERNRDAPTYRLGWRIFTLAQLAGEPRVIEEAAPILRDLVDSLSERVHLSVLQGAEVLTLLSESPSRAVEAVGWVGRVTPAYCTSAGFALLMDHTPEQLERLFAGISFDRVAPNTVRNVRQLAKRLETARENGYALADEEFESGLVAAAAPVRDPSGRVLAALNVSAPKFRFADQIESAALEIRAGAEALSLTLRGAPDQP